MVEVLCQYLSEWNEALAGGNPSENLGSPLNTARSYIEPYLQELDVTVYEDRCRCSRMFTVMCRGCAHDM